MNKKFKLDLIWAMYAVLVSIVCIYWALIATDKYVSVAHVVLQNPDVNPTVNADISSILSGGSSSSTRDILVLAEHLKSVDMLKKVDSQLDLRSHYSNNNIDFISRLESQSVPMETFHEYYLSMIDIEVDEQAGLLVLNVAAYSPDVAKKLSTLLLDEGEKNMNEMGQRLAREQVEFIQNQVLELGNKLQQARDAVLQYQNEHGLVSPVDTVESLSQVVSGLEAELAKMSAKKIAMSDYLSRNSPEMIRITSELDAIRQQIRKEKSKMTKESGQALNTISAEYETLQLQAEFALGIYSNALSALESIRVEAIRKLKQVSILQTPTLPEYAIEPKRLYNCTVFIILSLLILLIIQMLRAIINEHRD